MRLLFSSILLLLLSLAIDGHAEDCGLSTPIKDNFIVETWNKAKRAIFGGNKVPVGKWPWQVLITFVDEEDSSFLCGGTIIADSWILTAAHCFSEGRPVSVLYGSVSSADKGLNIVQNSTIHENYMDTDHERKITCPNDIALIKLNETIPFDDSASAICLPSKETVIRPDAQVMATGFGMRNDRSNLSIVPDYVASPDLLETVFPLMSHEVCSKRWYEIEKEAILDTQMCGGSYGHGTGKGDSGGPLVLYSKSRRWFQVGITSFGKNEPDKLFPQDISPGFYTDVKEYCDWIEENTGGDVKCQDADLVDATQAD